MTVEVGLWRLGDKPEKVRFVPIPKEEKLEDILAADLSILDPRLLLIGRQVLTGFGKFIDLLAMDADGKLVVIELKRDKTPREIVAQTLDYGSWIRDLEDDAIAAIFDAFMSKYHPDQSGISLDDAFRQKFGGVEPPENWNEGHELLIVAGHLDASTERIVNYLNDEHGVAINAVFFRFFIDEGREYLSRVWLIDPTEVEVKSVEAKSGEPWNGEFYANFGHGESRQWEEVCRRARASNVSGRAATFSNFDRATHFLRRLTRVHRVQTCKYRLRHHVVCTAAHLLERQDGC